MLTLICLYNICYFSLSPVAICYHYCVMPTIWSRSKYSTWPKQCLPDHKYQCLPNDQDQCPPNDQDLPHVLPQVSSIWQDHCLPNDKDQCLPNDQDQCPPNDQDRPHVLPQVSSTWQDQCLPNDKDQCLLNDQDQCPMKNVIVRSYLWTSSVFNEKRQCQVLPMDSISVQRNTSVSYVQYQCSSPD